MLPGDELSVCLASSTNFSLPSSARASLPGIRLPFKDNIWYEDLSRVVDISTTNLVATPRNRTLILDRGSGYSVKIQFVRDLNVAPVLEPEDHSRANDNAYYESRDPANRTLMRMCPYPLTKYYNLMMRTHLVSGFSTRSSIRPLGLLSGVAVFGKTDPQVTHDIFPSLALRV